MGKHAVSLKTPSAAVSTIARGEAGLHLPPPLLADR
jgi:hypothetical protein